MTTPPAPPTHGRWRVWLDLARAGNFPSVWSNALAALVLSATAARHWPSGRTWALATAGATLVYAGGATWNDVCDAAFDARHRPERPIASGRISRRSAGLGGAAELAAGLALLLAAGASPPAAAALAAVILAYDWIHKRWGGAIVLMAGCRALLALLIATLPGHGTLLLFRGWVAALFLYIVVLSWVARREYRPGGASPRLGRVVGSLLACMPLVDAAALAIAGAFGAAVLCAAALPLGRWAQRRAASN